MAVFFLYAGTQRVIIFVLFQQTPPKLLVLLFWDAKPYQMGLEKVSFSVGGGGSTMVAHCLCLSRQAGISGQLGKRGPSASCSCGLQSSEFSSY